MENISENITYLEATKSATAIKLGIDNTPSAAQLENMRTLAIHIFEPTRRFFGSHPIRVTSFFRSYSLNRVREVGGATNSQHMAFEGAAMDIDVDSSPYFHNYQIFNYILENLEFDQLIWEFGDKYNPAWVHVSYNEGKNRRQALQSYKNEFGKTKYRNYVG